MTTSKHGNEICIIPGSEATSNTAQTTGMERRAGIDGNTTEAKQIWLGHITAPPGMNSGRHHHGESETAAYVLSGHVRFYFGDGLLKYRDAGPGDFIFVPPHLPHIEVNLSPDEPAELILARSPDNIVVNLE